MERRHSIEVSVANERLGAGHPVRVQSMTDTITANIEATVRQILALAHEGSELVRLSVLDDEDAMAVPTIRAQLIDSGCHVPLVGDFHFNGHTLLKEHPSCAKALDKFRINPGNLGFGQSHDRNFASILEIAGKHDKAVRIGANWGSLNDPVRQRLLSEHADWPLEKVLEHAMIESTLESASFAINMGFPANKLVLSAKVSHVPSLLTIYRALAKKTDFALHLGLTEAGTGESAIIASTAAMSILLQEGIGDTLRVSITPPAHINLDEEDPRIQEVRVCQQILQANGLRTFVPTVRSCPGCGRTQREIHRSMVIQVSEFVASRALDWRMRFPGSETMVIAVMGCVVNGIKEAKHANVGISLPGRAGESPLPLVFSDGESYGVLQGENPGEQFTQFLENYIKSHFGSRVAK
ncbi:flavodoxin-dependent (E)-4-hydroxy-3-methylbut-2-enyl-diphosphate synthase [Candidatus Bipolaricaulota bacterium]|nr:flavodoxin-dependent (E)-4-hydroxy-3-methylbut-2-enyl-diphosphate synthase [Candidatus Bipolaricaulota bacterium]